VLNEILRRKLEKLEKIMKKVKEKDVTLEEMQSDRISLLE
jgi:hypothetical protein